MGAEVCRAVAGDPELELVAAVDTRFPDADAPVGVAAGPNPDLMAEAGVEVAVDFTVAPSAFANAPLVRVPWRARGHRHERPWRRRDRRR